MLKRLMQAAFALLVTIAFGCFPMLSLASDATASPPGYDIAVVQAPDAALDASTNMEITVTCYTDMDGADAGGRWATIDAPRHPLRR